MRFRSFLRFFRQLVPARKAKPRSLRERRRSALLLEALERREMPANNVPFIVPLGVRPLDGSVLTTGTPIIQVQYSEAMAASAADAANYLLIGTDGEPVTINSITLDSTRALATLQYNGGQALVVDTYTLFVRGTKVFDLDDGFPLAQDPQLIVANAGQNNLAAATLPGTGGIGAVSNYSLTGVGSNPFAVTLGDLDGDTLLDLIVVDAENNEVGLFKGRSAASGDGFRLTPDLVLTLPVGAANQPKAVVVADLTGDGKLDIVVANNNTDNVSAFINTRAVVGTLSFNRTDVTVDDSPVAIVAEDFDGDGNVDVGVALSTASTDIDGGGTNDFRINVLRGDGAWANAGNITLSRVIVGDAAPSGLTNPSSLVVGRLNADTRPDLAVGGNNGLRVIANNSTSGSFSFAPQALVSTNNVVALAAGAVDSGNTVDLVAALASNQVQVLRNNGNATFVSDLFAVVGNAGRVAVGDLNGDGKAEVLVTNGAASGRLNALRNLGVGGTISAAQSPATGADIVITSTNHGLSTGNQVTITGVAGNTNANGTFTITRVDANSFSLNGRTSNAPYTGGGTWVLVGSVTGTTGAGVSPIVVTSPTHGLSTGQRVTVSGVNGNTAANGTFTITKLDNDTFSLNGSTGSGAYTGGGTWQAAPVHLSAAPGSPYAVPSTPTGLALGDFNQDGKLDAVTANRNGAASDDVSVLYGNGDGGLFVSSNTNLTRPGTRSVAVGDVNRDGLADVVTVNNNPNTALTFVSVSLGLPGGTYAAPVDFAPGPAGLNMRDLVHVALADINGDGKLDIAVVDQTDNVVGILRNNTANGSTSLVFVPQTPVGVGTVPNQVVFADVNNDGFLDLFTPRKGPGITTGSVTGRLGKGDFTFENTREFDSQGFVSVGNFVGLVIIDYNRDGALDLVAAEDFFGSEFIDWWTGDGRGNFQYVSFTSASLLTPSSIAAGDFNGDSYPDVVVASTSAFSFFDGVAVHLNQGGTGFTFGTRSPVFPGVGLQQVVATDLNQDGKTDVIASAQSGINNVAVLIGNGDGTFNEPVPYLAGNPGSNAGPSFIGLTQSSALLPVTTFESGGNLVRPNLIANGDFEDKDLTTDQGNLLGWRTFKLPDNPGGSHGQWGSQTGTTSPRSTVLVPVPTGRFRAMLDQENLIPIFPSFFGPPINPNPGSNYSGSHALYQDITIPTGATSVTLTMSLYIDNSDSRLGSSSGLPTGAYSDVNANPLLDYRTAADNQQVRVDIVDPSVPVLSVTPRTISGATKTSPIVITSFNHGLSTGAQLQVTGVLGNTAANGLWTVTVLDQHTFSLNGSTGNGDYISGGTWTSVLRNLFVTKITDAAIQQVTVTDTDLLAFKGKTVRLRIASTNNRGRLIVGVDNVKVRAMFADTRVPTVSNLTVRNPGFLGNPGGTTPHTTDPTIVGQVSDEGGLKNVKFLAFDLKNNGFGGADDLKIFQWDSLGRFSFTVPTAQPGLNTIPVQIVDRAGNKSNSLITFFLQSDNNTEWQSVGPTGVNVANQAGMNVSYTRISGRITSIIPDVGDPTGNSYFVGTANGGVWKTTTGGNDWTPLTDFVLGPGNNRISVSVGGLAQSRSSPNVLYAATGVGDRNYDSRPGFGIIKSVDGGKTWQAAGNSATLLAGARAVKMFVDANNPDLAFAAVAEGPGGSGIFRTLDGGATWANVLVPTQMIDQGGVPLPAGTQLASVTDLIMDPFNSQRLIVGLGNIGLVPNSNTAGVWRSANQGATWDRIVGGDDPRVPNNTLPFGTNIGRVTLAIGSGRVGNERYVYALLSNPPGSNNPPGVDFGSFSGLFRSKDNMLNWTKVMMRENVPIVGSPPHRFVDITLLGDEAANAGALVVDPANPNVVYVGGSNRFWDTKLIFQPPGRLAPFSLNTPPHAFVRVDTGNMRDTEHLVIDRILNDGDDRDKSGCDGHPAMGCDRFYNPPTNSDPYTGEGVYWYDLIQDLSGDTNFFHGDDLPPSITSLAFDAQGRLLVGTPRGIWRGGLKGFSYDFTSGQTGFWAFLGATAFSAPAMDFVSLNGNLQIADTTAVAVDPFTPGVFYTSMMHGGAAVSTRPLTWNSQGLSGPTVSLSSLPLTLESPNLGTMLMSNPAPGAQPGTPVTLFRMWQYTDSRGFRPEISGDNGVTWSATESAGINITGNPTRPFPAMAINPNKVFESGQFQDELLFGTDKVFLTRTSGAVWDPISTALSARGGLISALAFAPSRAGVFYAGTDKGEVFRTLDKGADGFPERDNGLPVNQPGVLVNGITVDPNNHLKAYAMFGGNTGSAGHVFRTLDGGLTWTNISNNLPDVPAYAMVIDPRPGLGSPNGKIYVGTEVGVFFSANGGDTWQPAGQGFPHVPALFLFHSQQQDTLAAATIGRGVFVISTAAISRVTDRVIDEDTSTGPIFFSINALSAPPESIQVSVTSSNTTLVPPSNVVLSGFGTEWTVTITPAANLSGQTTMRITASVGGSTVTRDFKVTVLAVNDLPIISPILNQTVAPNTVIGPLAFTISDVETTVDKLTVTASSDNQTLIPNANITLTGAGANWTIRVRPAANQIGTARVSIQVKDTDGGIGVSFFDVLINGPATLPFSDNFNRGANSFLGVGWLENLGDFQVGGERARVESELAVATLNGVTQANASAKADIFLPTSGIQHVGLVLRYSGPGDSNMYLGVAVAADNVFTAQIWKNVGGLWTRLTSTTLPAPAGTLRFEAVGSALKLFLGDSLLTNTYDSSLTSGSIGLRASQGVELDNFSAETITLLTPVLPFTDTFNQPDGSSLNRNWLERAGTFTVQATAQASVLRGNDALNLAGLNGIARVNASAQAKVTLAAPGQHAGLVARYSGTADDNMYLGAISMTSTGSVISLWKNVGGTWSLLASDNVTFSGTGLLRLEVNGPSLKLFLDGSFKLLTFDTQLAAPGTLGIRASAGAGIDDFTADVITASATGLPFSDPFNTTANRQLGGNWTEHAGNFLVQNDVARGSAGLVNLAVLNGIAAGNVAVQGDVTVTTAQYAGFVARFAGAGDQNMYFAALGGDGSDGFIATIWKNVAGTWTRISSQTVAGGTGTLRLEVVATSLKLFLNGSLVGFAFDASLSGAGGIGMRISQGATVDNFNASAITLNSNALPFSEPFNATPNGQLSRNWLERAGNFRVQSGNAQTTGGSLNLATVSGISAGDVSVQVNVTVPVGQHAGLVARYTGSGDDNMYLGALSNHSTGPIASIWKNVAGTWSLLHSQAASFAAGTLRFEVVKSSLKLFLADTLIAFASDSSISGGGTVGIRASQGVLIDDFNSNVITLTSPTLPFSDNFAATADGQLTRNWLARLGNFRLQGGTAQANAALNIATVNGIAQTNMHGQADVTVPVGQHAGLTARYTGSADDNMYLGALSNHSTGAVASIWKNLGGVWTQLANQAVAAASGTLRFEVVGTSLKLFLNGSLAAFVHDSSITAAGTVGLRVGQGVVVDNFDTNVVTLTSPSLPLSEPFNTTADRQLSRNWLERAGNFRLQGGTAQASSSFNIATLNGVAQANIFAAADVSVGAGQFAGLIGRYSGPDDTNMYFGGLGSVAGGFEVTLWRNVGGTWTRLAAQAVAGGTGRLRLEIQGTQLRLLLGGIQVASATDSQISGTGTVGLRTSGGVTIDNFAADTLP